MLDYAKNEMIGLIDYVNVTDGLAPRNQAEVPQECRRLQRPKALAPDTLCPLSYH